MPPGSYFRRPDSSGSDTSESEEEREDSTSSLNRDLAGLGVSNPTSSVGSVGRDLLIHALLEERCLNQVRSEYAGQDESIIQQEAQRRYHVLCQQLAPLNLFSAGLEGSDHRANRQFVRDGLDRLPLASTSGASASRSLQQAPRTPVPTPLRRYLTDGGMANSPSLLDTTARLYQLQSPTRFHRDFERIGLLGKGGYGEVYQVRHHVDRQVYAVKKVPIPAALVQRINNEGEAVMDEVLKEVRSLSRLAHPNIVRYNNSWIEWSTEGGLESASSELDVHHDGEVHATHSQSLAMSSLSRIRTETDTDEHLGISFESRSRDITVDNSANANLLATFESRVTDSYVSNNNSVNGDQNQLSFSGPYLALYLQMSVYPMTLADYISPKKTTEGIEPLAHCFHLEPSIRILLSILEGVEYMHAQKIVHRDLKPANVFLKHEDNPRSNPSCVDLSACADCQAENKSEPIHLSVCIGDFGLVTTTALTAHVDASPAKAVGTEIYRPAVSTLTSNISPRLDIFAVGVIACELLCKFDTQMERRSTLNELKNGRFPRSFGRCAGRQASSLKECIASMLSEDAAGVTLAELRQKLSSMLSPNETSSGQRVGGREDVLRRSST